MSFSVINKDNSKAWSHNEMVILYEKRAYENMPYSYIGKILNRTGDSCRNKFRDTKWEKTGIPDYEKLTNINNKTQKGIDDIEISINHNLDKYRMRADIVSDKLSQALDRLPECKLQKWEPKNKPREKHSPEDMGLMLSDLHIGHEHSLQETGGISAYSIDIFKNRLQNLQYAVADIFELHSNLYKIPALHVFSLGDIVDGMNNAGAWSPVYISTPIYDQVIIGYTEIAKCLWYWLNIFEEIHFYGIRGNHGRTDRLGAEKDYNNWDNIIYEMLKLQFKDNPRIHFHIPKTWWMLKTIRNHKFLMVHGDDVKSKSPPVKSLLDFETKMSGIIKDIPNYTLAGHFHNASEYTTHNGRCIINGAFTGGDMYSLKNYMPGTRPEQKLFGIHDKRGITYTYNVDLDQQREDRLKSIKEKK